MKPDKVLSYLGLAMRGRNLVSGEFQTEEAVKSGAFFKENMPAVPMEAFQSAPFVLLKEENDTLVII